MARITLRHSTRRRRKDSNDANCSSCSTWNVVNAAVYNTRRFWNDRQHSSCISAFAGFGRPERLQTVAIAAPGRPEILQFTAVAGAQMLERLCIATCHVGFSQRTQYREDTKKNNGDILNTRNFVEHEVVAEIVNAREQLPQFSLVCKGGAVAPRSTPCCLCGGAAPATHPVSKHEPVQQGRHFSMVQWFAKSTTPQPPPPPAPQKNNTHTHTYCCIHGPVLCLRMPIL